MKNVNIDLKQAFNDYFHEMEGFSTRSERFYDVLEACPISRRQALAKGWLEAAFIAGTRAMANDTIEALGDYATSTSGINEVKYNISEAYDIASADLRAYYKKVLP